MSRSVQLESAKGGVDGLAGARPHKVRARAVRTDEHIAESVGLSLLHCFSWGLNFCGVHAQRRAHRGQVAVRVRLS